MDSKLMQGDDWTWTTKQGEQLHLQNMQTSHILNCMAMIEKIGFYTSEIIGGSFDSKDYWCEEAENDYTPVYNNMVLELRLRKIAGQSIG